MKKHIFFLLSIITTSTIIGSSQLIAYAQFEDVWNRACSGDASDSVACNEVDRAVGEENPVTSTTQDVVDLLSLVIGMIAVVIIIIAGITMTMSQGDAGKIKSSRDAIIYSAVGVVVVALSRTIIIFIINRTS